MMSNQGTRVRAAPRLAGTARKMTARDIASTNASPCSENRYKPSFRCKSAANVAATTVIAAPRYGTSRVTSGDAAGAGVSELDAGTGKTTAPASSHLLRRYSGRGDGAWRRDAT